MKIQAVRVLLLGLALCAAAAAVPTRAAQEPPLIPMRDFFRNPEKVQYRLSPDGESIAFLMPWQNRLNVHVQKVGDVQKISEEKVTRVTESTERDIMAFTWKGNDRILYIQDKGGDENWRLYAVNTDGTGLKELTPFEKVQTRFVDVLEDNDHEAIISLNKRDPRVFDVYRINVDTGEMTMIAQNPGNISRWMTDNQGRLRIAQTTDRVNTSLLYRKTEADSFRTVVTTSFKDDLEPIYFTFDDSLLYVASNLNRDKDAIYRYDPEQGKLLDLIYENPEVDVTRLLRSKARKVITGVTYVTDRTRYHFLDDQRRKLQEKLEKELPGYQVGVAGMSRDEGKVLAVTYSDRTWGTYYIYDVKKGKLARLAEISPWLDEKVMAEMKPIQFTARDGLLIHGYLTLPRGAKPKNLPTVVNPHGGPWARDDWGFNPEVQFLANRGYAVLQINFRGSTGYGKAFWQSSFKQWGRAMQDDITDGAQWLIKEGIADPKRIAIYGASYGGYATLAGVAFTPDLYACGVDYVGVSNLFTFMNTFPPYWELGRKMMYEMVGDPDADKEMMTAASPFFHADQIKVPLLVAQGANDPRVNKAESDQMVDALKQRGIDVTYMVKENEGHGFMLEENRFDFYRAMEEFLGRHLGGRVEQTTETAPAKAGEAPVKAGE
jgi:dipeptidyl aminopeptidase/acylaminoacyl peptidase